MTTRLLFAIVGYRVCDVHIGNIRRPISCGDVLDSPPFLAVTFSSPPLFLLLTRLLLPLFSRPTPQCSTFSSFLFPSPSSRPQICFVLSSVVCSLSESGLKLKQRHSLWQYLSWSSTNVAQSPLLSLPSSFILLFFSQCILLSTYV